MTTVTTDDGVGQKWFYKDICASCEAKLTIPADDFVQDKLEFCGEVVYYVECPRCKDKLLYYAGDLPKIVELESKK